MSYESCNNLFDYRVCPGFNLSFGLVLNRMRHVNSVKIGSPQRRGLRSGGKHELVRGDRDRGQSQVFQS